MIDWSDPSWKFKPKKTRKPVEEPQEKGPMKCLHCGLPYLITLKEHCRCSPWEVGKPL